MLHGNEVSENIFSFDTFNFENKLIEVVEELRLKRKLEVENEATIKKIFQEKYDLESSMEDQQRKFVHEKNDLEQEISLLKRKLEDRICIADDEKAKFQKIMRTFAQELRTLKEESRVLHSEKLNLEKKVQEREGKLHLHANFQETAMRQMTKVRQDAQELSKLYQNLTIAQEVINDNVSEVKTMVQKYDLCNKHLSSIISMNEKRNSSLQKDIITLSTKLAIKNKSTDTAKQPPTNSVRNEQDYQRILKLESIIFQASIEKKKTASNLHESSKLLAQHIKKLEALQVINKERNLEMARLQSQLSLAEEKYKVVLSKFESMEESYTLLMKKRHVSVETQVERTFTHDESTQTNKCFVLPSTAASNESDRDSEVISQVSLLGQPGSNITETDNLNHQKPSISFSSSTATAEVQSSSSLVSDRKEEAAGMFEMQGQCHVGTLASNGPANVYVQEKSMVSACPAGVGSKNDCREFSIGDGPSASGVSFDLILSSGKITVPMDISNVCSSGAEDQIEQV